MSNAPYHRDIANGPADGHAVWAHSSDGARIRVGLWPREGAKGTILIFTGRTEYIEKYGPAAAEFSARGYASLAIDWRGQGLADRMLDDPRTGHVMHFTDYQNDVAAAIDVAERHGFPKPLYLVAHSMGGCIGLRSVMDGLDVRAAVFSAPMWGIRISPILRPIAWIASWVSRLLGLSHGYVPGTKPAPYTETADFKGNQLTTDREMYDWMKYQIQAYPDLALGGPSLRWLNEALAETYTLWTRRSPDLPCLTFLGDNERIVDTARIHERMKRWPGGRLEIVRGGEHEVMMEQPHIRNRVFDDIAQFFDDHN